MQICLTMSAAPILDRQISAPSLRCLLLLRTLAGQRRMFQTLTCSIARQLGRCTNTVRTYRAELVDAGYIWWVTDPRTGITTVMIRTSVEPGGGAQSAAPIKPRKISPPFQHLAAAGRRAWQQEKVAAIQRMPQIQPPVRTVAEQIAALSSSPIDWLAARRAAAPLWMRGTPVRSAQA